MVCCHHLRWRRRTWHRIGQLLLLLVSGLVVGVVRLQVPRYISGGIDRRPPRSRHLHPQDLLLPNVSELINLRDFRYLINVPNLCDPHEDVYLLNFVHSSPSHFEQRRSIRRSWGGVRNIGGRTVRTVFLLGRTSPRRQQFVLRESRAHGDIVQGNFVDAYANLSYKHVMGHKWCLQHCNRTKFILKTDEDVYIDMFQLVQFLLSLYGSGPRGQTLMCYVYPRGTPALREGKWTVARTDYPYAGYPRYCAGLAYFLTPDVARDLVAASAHIPFFWIDDVYVTGMLADALRLRHLSLNLRTTLDSAPLQAWLRSNSSFPSRYIVGSLGDLRHWEELLGQLWKKTLAVYGRRSLSGR